jgi:NAD(P)-dependent dehydrogenase (short-subunit alcohol dehydrogenase family)/rhamnose utilization protein RhaD (predicted bifunctional aldolase and dehydrogenase)
MNTELKHLIDVSHYYGKNKDYTIAGGGNTSYKNLNTIWIKASGTSLATITEAGFVALDRSKLALIPGKEYSPEPSIREQQVKEDLYASSLNPQETLRPSVETSLHECINYSYVVHLHPTLVNALMCSQDSKKLTAEFFSDALYIPYIDPGYTLFMKVYEEIRQYRKKFSFDPKIIFLENHGVFVSADTTAEVMEIYALINSTLETRVNHLIETSDIPTPDNITEWIPAVRMLFSQHGLKTCSLRHNDLIAHYYQDQESFARISAPFTPDIIVYCKSRYLFIEDTSSPETIVESVRVQLNDFLVRFGYFPKIILVKNCGLLAIDETWQAADICLDIFEDLMKISHYAHSFGGPRFMTAEQISFIDNWEVEHYRRKVSQGMAGQGKVNGKIAVVTGGAMGFGAGIATSLAEQGANVIIADINEEDGVTLASLLSEGKKNKAIFIPTDVGDPNSVNRMIKHTVEHFGGVDLFVSNAGILYAGSLDEMQPAIFERMTRVNYMAFFYCTKYASAVMKLQYEHNPAYHTDIIQINSKSGLRGSNKNFAYAGGKFGGIGLVQSFALELMPYQIKVNAICPGNFFEGPLWSDPEKGLFVQYLEAGKVNGANTIEDVKAHYEKQVPAGRGCQVKDVAKAMYYLIDQEYETGQALPVTGGQVMLH